MEDWGSIHAVTGVDGNAARFPKFDFKNDVVIWAETSGEAEEFLEKAHEHEGKFAISRVYVGKKSGQHRGNDYLRGKYFEYSLSQRGALDEGVTAPQSIIDLVQWCAPDVIVSVGARPVLSIEDTTHLQGDNLFQRLPRVVRSSMLGVPAVTFQGIGPHLNGRAKHWCLHRFMTAQLKAYAIYKTPCLVILYEDEAEKQQGQRELLDLFDDAVLGRAASFKARADRILGDMEAHLSTNPESVPAIRCIEVQDRKVRVLIGVRPERKSWKEKGSGQMDTYVGLIFAARLLFGIDEHGSKIRDVVAYFKHLPSDFWWFDESNASLYNRLPKEFSDRYEFGFSQLGVYNKDP